MLPVDIDGVKDAYEMHTIFYVIAIITTRLSQAIQPIWTNNKVKEKQNNIVVRGRNSIQHIVQAKEKTRKQTTKLFALRFEKQHIQTATITIINYTSERARAQCRKIYF